MAKICEYMTAFVPLLKNVLTGGSIHASIPCVGNLAIGTFEVSSHTSRLGNGFLNSAGSCRRLAPQVFPPYRVQKKAAPGSGQMSKS